MDIKMALKKFYFYTRKPFKKSIEKAILGKRLQRSPEECTVRLYNDPISAEDLDFLFDLTIGKSHVTEHILMADPAKGIDVKGAMFPSTQFSALDVDMSIVETRRIYTRN